ncbi:MAG: cytochrome P450 [Aliidongia sp.]
MDGLASAEKNDRKSTTPPLKGVLERSIRIEDFETARQILRDSDLRQAGFEAEVAELLNANNLPIIYQTGEVHQKLRSAVARFFAAKVVMTRYRKLMESCSESQMARIRVTKRARLEEITFELSVVVIAEILGLTESKTADMAVRLNRFFDESFGVKTGLPGRLKHFFRALFWVLKFYIFDVRPAIRAHLKAPKDDLISHLIEQGYSHRQILIECLAYSGAGMLGPREFMVMAAWHLFERDDLRTQFLATNEDGRIAILEEILRLEPVTVGLYRRADRDLTVKQGAASLFIPAGTVITIDIGAVNCDPSVAGECPHALDPARDRCNAGKETFASLMGFGDGPHRCPGASVALQESAIFLDRLFRIPGIRLERVPDLTWHHGHSFYILRGAIVSID